MVSLLNPLGVCFIIGVVSYFNGTPHLTFSGLPSESGLNLDRSTRCFRATTGCVVSGNEWVLQAPNNIAVSSLIHLFGPPKNSYTGYYPTREEALSALENAEPTPLETLLQNQLITPQGKVTLPAGTVDQWADEYRLFIIKFYRKNPQILDFEKLTIKATVVDGECLIIRFQVSRDDQIQTDIIALYDAKRFWLFAHYRLDDGSARSLPYPGYPE